MGGGYSSGNAEKAFESGIGTTLTLFGFSLSMIFIGRYLVPGVSRFPGVSTVGGIIGQCYGRSARLLTGIFSFICCAGVVGAQMEACLLYTSANVKTQSVYGYAATGRMPVRQSRRRLFKPTGILQRENL